MRVLITQPAQDAAVAAAALRALGHEVLMAPLVSAERATDPKINLSAAQGFIVASAEGARALADNVGVRTFPVFCESEVTAAELRRLGFKQVNAAKDDTTELAKLIERSLKPANGALIYACSTSTGPNLGAMLGNMGFAVRMAPLFALKRAESLPGDLRAALKDKKIDVALFLSPDEARAFVNLVQREELEALVQKLPTVAATPIVAAPLRALKLGAVAVPSASDPETVFASLSESLVDKVEAERLEREKFLREEAEKKRAEEARLVAEQAERDRIAREQAEKERAEQERLAREKAEKERAAREKTEQERLAKEQAEREKAQRKREAQEQAEREKTAKRQAQREQDARDRAERERLAKERDEQERTERARFIAEREEKDRLAWEKFAAEKAERERLEAERAAQDKVEREKRAVEKTERDRIAAEKAAVERAERQRQAAERAERDRIERERQAMEKAERDRVAQEQIAKANTEKERLALEKAERDRQDRERKAEEKAERDRIAREKAEVERAEKQRVAAEKAERDRQEQERKAEEKAERDRIQREKDAADDAARRKRMEEQIEHDLKERQRIAAAREEQERIEWERFATQRAERERLEAEKAEQNRTAREKRDQEKAEKARIARLREDEERDKAARERRGKQEAERASAEPKPSFGARLKGWFAKKPASEQDSRDLVWNMAHEEAKTAAPAVAATVMAERPSSATMAPPVAAPAQEPEPVPQDRPQPEEKKPVTQEPPQTETSADKTGAPTKTKPAQRGGGRAARLMAEDAADDKAKDQRFKYLGFSESEPEPEPASTEWGSERKVPPPRRSGGGLRAATLFIVLALMALAVVSTASWWVPRVTSLVQGTPVPPTTTAAPQSAPADSPATMQADITALKARVAVLEQEAVNTVTPDALNATKQELAQRLTVLEGRAGAAAPAGDEAVTSLGDSVSSQARQLAAVTARIATLEAAIGNSARLEDVSKRLNVLEGRSAEANSVLALSDRVTALETTGRRAVAEQTVHVALLVAVAQWREAVSAGTPFALELQTVKAIAAQAGQPAVNDGAFASYAATGLPTLADLQRRFRDTAAAAMRASAVPDGTSAWYRRIFERAMSIVVVRRLDGDAAGTGTSAVLARAEKRLAEANLAAAVAEVSTLTGGAATAVESWLAPAKARVAAETNAAEATTKAVAAVAAGANAPATPAKGQ